MGCSEGRGHSKNDLTGAGEKEAEIKRGGAAGDNRSDEKTLGGGSGRGEEVGEKLVGVNHESNPIVAPNEFLTSLCLSETPN
jgi:hypothetical protein